MGSGVQFWQLMPPQIRHYSCHVLYLGVELFDSEITRKPEGPVSGPIRVSSESLGTGPESVAFPRVRVGIGRKCLGTHRVRVQNHVCACALVCSAAAAALTFADQREVGTLCDALLG